MWIVACLSLLLPSSGMGALVAQDTLYLSSSRCSTCMGPSLQHPGGKLGGEAGFDRAFRTLGAAPCQGPDAEGACRLMLCNVLHYVLVIS